MHDQYLRCEMDWERMKTTYKHLRGDRGRVETSGTQGFHVFNI